MGAEALPMGTPYLRTSPPCATASTAILVPEPDVLKRGHLAPGMAQHVALAGVLRDHGDIVRRFDAECFHHNPSGHADTRLRIASGVMPASPMRSAVCPVTA